MIGIDEVGMSPIAGPVVVGGVRYNPLLDTLNLKDSKQLKPNQRTDIAKKLLDLNIDYSIIVIMPEFIEKGTLVEGVMRSIPLIIKDLNIDFYELITIDGKNHPEKYFKKRDPELADELSKYNIKAIVKADTFIPEVQAAAILAKVFRDSLMKSYHILFPFYDWQKNFGYYSRSHVEGIKKYGISPLHRKRLICSRNIINLKT